MHKLRKSKQTQHTDWADTVFSCDVAASHVMPHKEDMLVSFPLALSLPDKCADPFLCNPPPHPPPTKNRHYLHADKVAKLFYKTYFRFFGTF